MSLAVLASQALAGARALPVRVEVHVGPGLPVFHIVGLPDAGVRESRERVRSAIVNSGFEFPAGRVTVNLAPADLPKESGRFDLPIALGVLLASGQLAVADTLPAAPLAHYVFAGELSLTGHVMKVLAPLSLALGLASTAPGRVFVLPGGDAAMAAHVSGITVFGASSLRQVADHLQALDVMPSPKAAPFQAVSQAAGCLSEVRGQALARRALEAAACGAHSVLMVGPPGAGKSMLAQRLPGILPPLTRQQSLEALALRQLGSDAIGVAHLDGPVPFRAPHHSTSVAALIGGGAYPRPGEISRAHHGVLFLDELPEFARASLEALREPLETRQVVVARAARAATFPASFQLVAAMNPCPCGWTGHARKPCRCTPAQVDRYRNRISGPFLDRVDVQIALQANDADWLDAPAGESSDEVRQRVIRCRARQLQRQAVPNSQLAPAQVVHHCTPDADGAALLRQGMTRWNWSSRAVHRVLKVARSLADMDACDTVAGVHVAEAMQYRQAWH